MSRLLTIILTLLLSFPATALPPETLRSVVSVLPVWPGLPQGGTSAPPGTAPEGSGIAITEHLIVTAAHVIGNATRIDIRLEDGRIVPVTLLARDPATDIALLQSDTGLPPIQIAPEPELAEPVCAIGNAFGLGLSVSCGVVSATHVTNAGFNEIEDFLQTDAAVNPGSSGGALVNKDGDLVGMLSAIFASGADANLGINFAVAPRLLLDVASDLSCHGEVWRSDPGWQLVAPSRAQLQQSAGVVVADVKPDGVAARAGLLPGDMLTGIDKRPIRSRNDATTAIALTRPGMTVAFTLIRAGQQVVLSTQNPQRREPIATPDICYLLLDN